MLVWGSLQLALALASLAIMQQKRGMESTHCHVNKNKQEAHELRTSIFLTHGSVHNDVHDKGYL